MTVGVHYHIKWTIDVDCILEGKPGDSSEKVNERIADALVEALRAVGLSGPISFQGQSCRMVPKEGLDVN